MFSTRSPKKNAADQQAASTSRRSAPVKTLLAYNDSGEIEFRSCCLCAYIYAFPVCDARKMVVDFTSALDRLSEVLPLFPDEVPSRSFAIVYTVSSYMASIGGDNDKLPHIGCSVLWVIVCGTVSLRFWHLIYDLVHLLSYAVCFYVHLCPTI
jgi:hypothetical protein